MNTNDKTNSKLDPQNKDEAIAEVSATEADTVAGGAGLSKTPPDPLSKTQSPDFPSPRPVAIM